jgi:hypothetical protein
MEIPFGKYKGFDVRDLPEHYLCWLKDNVQMNESLRLAVEYALFLLSGEIGAEDAAKDARFPTDARDMARLVISQGFRQLAGQVHPDKGGSHVAMVVLNHAKEYLQELIVDHPPDTHRRRR